ncbi:hypothetical protein SLA2020_031600 [Shorea laevis]
MNEIQGRRAQNFEKFPGCLGRMVNLFDLSAGVPGNRLLSDKPHRDGSSLSRSHSDRVRMLSPSFQDPIEDKVIVSELRRNSSNQKTNGTPMKTLIAQEMSKEVESNPPNVVAKLMGLETLPRQQPKLAAQRSHSKGSSRRSMSHSEMPVESWEQDKGFLDKQIECDVHHCQELNKYKDVYEISQSSQKTNYSRDNSPQDNSPQKGRYYDGSNERKTTLVHQKFMEAKHLVTDEKCRHSKEFQDALEVLSTNKELFLKFLQEPNSMFSQHLSNLQSLPPPPETKRITVLRPSKMVENDKLAGTRRKGNKHTKKPAQVGQVTGWERNNPGYPFCFANEEVNEYPAQPTRIVVLKPSPGKPQDIKTVVSPSPSSPSILHGEDFYEPEDVDAQESREVAMEIKRQMCENLIGHRRDETLLSSVFSNDDIGDDSSFNKAENEYATGNLSDSEVMSPTSRHSCDCINRLGSPYSSSSFGRMSCSPDSSVCREAKKRLSERWAMMALNGRSEEQKHVGRSSSTLGEMLALSDTKKEPARSDEEESNKEQEPRGSTSSAVNKEDRMKDSPKNLLRSKSVPVFSTAFGMVLNVGVSDLEPSKMQGSMEAMKAKGMKSSLKVKVSSLFFSKNKKLSEEKPNGSQSVDDSPSATPGTPGSPVINLQKSNGDVPQCVNESSIEECLSPGLSISAKKTADLTSMAKKEGIVSGEAGLSLAKPLMPWHVSENQDQPSPISVLDPPFEEDEATILGSSCNIKLEHQGVEVLPKSNLIGKSPPIESIARMLSWDGSCAETPTYPSKPSSGSPCRKEEEQDWLSFVQSLLSAAGLDPEAQSDSFIARWHLPESPLNPSLREKCVNLNEEESVHEAKRRQWRSNQKLAFDCVNSALVEITCYGLDGSIKTTSFGRREPTKGAPSTLVDHVWAQMKDWFASDGKCTPGDDGDSNSLVVRRVVRNEVVVKGWVDQMKLEMDNLGNEIEGKLLEELVEESLVDLTGRVLQVT